MHFKPVYSNNINTQLAGTVSYSDVTDIDTKLWQLMYANRQWSCCNSCHNSCRNSCGHLWWKEKLYIHWFTIGVSNIWLILDLKVYNCSLELYIFVSPFMMLLAIISSGSSSIGHINKKKEDFIKCLRWAKDLLGEILSHFWDCYFSWNIIKKCSDSLRISGQFLVQET